MSRETPTCDGHDHSLFSHVVITSFYAACNERLPDYSNSSLPRCLHAGTWPNPFGHEGRKEWGGHHVRTSTLITVMDRQTFVLTSEYSLCFTLFLCLFCEHCGLSVYCFVVQKM